MSVDRISSYKLSKSQTTQAVTLKSTSCHREEKQQEIKSVTSRDEYTGLHRSRTLESRMLTSNSNLQKIVTRHKRSNENIETLPDVVQDAVNQLGLEEPYPDILTSNRLAPQWNLRDYNIRHEVYPTGPLGQKRRIIEA